MLLCNEDRFTLLLDMSLQQLQIKYALEMNFKPQRYNFNLMTSITSFHWNNSTKVLLDTDSFCKKNIPEYSECKIKAI